MAVARLSPDLRQTDARPVPDFRQTTARLLPDRCQTGARLIFFTRVEMNKILAMYLKIILSTYNSLYESRLRMVSAKFKVHYHTDCQEFHLLIIYGKI